jgi:hypothetical protein
VGSLLFVSIPEITLFLAVSSQYAEQKYGTELSSGLFELNREMMFKVSSRVYR